MAIGADGSFSFATNITNGGEYLVTVATQPTNLNQTCSVTNGTGTVSGANISNISISCVTTTYSVSVTVSELAGTGLVLQNNGGDDLAIGVDGSFTFASVIDDGSTYNITVFSQPVSSPNKTCTVANGSGILSGVDITNVTVSCINTYTVSSIVPSEEHACALLNDGTVRCWGDNTNGYLGLGSKTNHRGDAADEMGDALPALSLGTNLRATQIAQGENHTCAIFNWRVKCWGDNSYGQLGGDPDKRPGDEPDEMGDALVAVNLGTDNMAVAITAGANHTCVILEEGIDRNGSVKCWGYNNNGQLGLGDRDNRGDDAGEMGDNLLTVDLGTDPQGGYLGATAIAAGKFHTCALLSSGEPTYNARLKCWGYNKQGQLGQGDSLSRGTAADTMVSSLPLIDLGTVDTTGDPIFATAISAAGYNTCALLDDQTVKCWGDNYQGQLGQGDTERRGDNPSEMGDDLPEINLGSAFSVGTSQISSGDNYVCAISNNNEAKCWGNNNNGQLGLGDYYHRGDELSEMGNNLPVVDVGTGRTVASIAAATTGSHTCALLDDDTVKCWGNNSYGQLGQGDIVTRGYLPNEMGDDLPPINLGSGLAATAISAGSSQSCALLSNQDMKCWGNATYGQLGLGESYRPGDEAGELAVLSAIALGAGRTATAIVGGGYHNCALLDDHTVKCWGSNNAGQLGLGDLLTRGDKADEMGDNLLAVDLGTGRTATAIAAGEYHSCALLDDASLKCWGYNAYGQLGQGDTSYRGSSSNQMGDDLLPINLGDGRTATAVTAAVSSTCALLDDASLKCWGNNSKGQLGQGHTDHLGDNIGEMGEALLPIDLGINRTAIAIAVGSSSYYGHICAQLDNGSLKCWGNNLTGQLGLGDIEQRGDEAGEMGDLLPTVNLGTDEQGNDLTVTSISAGSGHSCALLNDASLKCWGINYLGQLGQGDTNMRGNAAYNNVDNLSPINLGLGVTITDISAGYDQSCALLSDGNAKCWGENGEAQLGAGSVNTNLGDETNEMGDNLPQLEF